MSINISKVTSEALTSVDINVWLNETDKILTEAKKNVDAIANILKDPGVIRSEYITAFRNAIQEEIRNCVNCEDKKLLTKFHEKLFFADLYSLKQLKKEPTTLKEEPTTGNSINNPKYKPYDIKKAA